MCANGRSTRAGPRGQNCLPETTKSIMITFALHISAAQRAARSGWVGQMTFGGRRQLAGRSGGCSYQPPNSLLSWGEGQETKDRKAVKWQALTRSPVLAFCGRQSSLYKMSLRNKNNKLLIISFEKKINNFSTKILLYKNQL